MRHRALAFAAASLLAVPAIAARAQAEEGGCALSMAEMDWASAELMANVDRILLEKGLGCTVEMVPGATNTVFASMNEKGAPQVAAEFWFNAVREPLEKAIGEGRLKVVNETPITGLGEGWWVTKAFHEAHPEIDSVEKMLARPDLVPSAEDPSKGAFFGCPAGWGCQGVNANLFRAFDMAKKGWVMVDPGSAAGLDGAIAKASERGEPWFGYYWAPTAIVGKYEMVLLPFEAPFAGAQNWDGCIALPEDQCAEPRPTAWIPSDVRSIVTADLAAAGGPALDYLARRSFPGDVMNEMLGYMQDNQATGEDAAFHFLQTHADLWSGWLPPEAAQKVRDGL